MYQKIRNTHKRIGHAERPQEQPEGVPSGQSLSNLSNEINNDSIGLQPIEYNNTHEAVLIETDHWTNKWMLEGVETAFPYRKISVNNIKGIRDIENQH